MASFTAINTFPTPEIPCRDAAVSAQAQVSTSLGRRRDTASVVSEYLGLGENTKQSLPAVATHLQKAATKGKKRSSLPSETRESKRRKSNSTITATVPVSKAVPQNTAKYSTKFAAHEQTSPAQSTRSTRKKNRVSSAVNVNIESTQHPLDSISVYAPTTSMDVFDSTSMRTSVESVKAGGDFGCTLYQSVPSSGNTQTAVQFSTPLLPSAPNQSTNEDVNSTKGRDKSGSGTLNEGQSTQRPTRKAKKDAMQKNSLLLRGPAGKDTIAPPSSQRSPGTQRPDIRPQATSAADRIIIPLRDTNADELESALDDDIDAAALIDLATAIDDEDEDELTRRPKTPPARNHKQNMRDVDEHEDYGGALLSYAERQLLEERRSASQGPKAIARKAFPRAMFDRSSIAGASNATLLRTCFRLGEAFNTGSQAVRTNSNVVIELYARVTSSWREQPPGRKQHFAFADIYHDKPPHLEGTFELFNQATLWDLDSQVFLGSSTSGTLCRAIVRMKRDPQQKWRLEILSIWEAAWEDVEHAAGICRSNVPSDSSD